MKCCYRFSLEWTKILNSKGTLAQGYVNLWSRAFADDFVYVLNNVKEFKIDSESGSAASSNTKRVFKSSRGQGARTVAHNFSIEVLIESFFFQGF